MGTYVNVLVGLFVGSLVVIQGGMNARLMATLGGGTPTTLVNFVIGALVMLCASVLSGQLEPVSQLMQAPRWSLLGGVAGALLVMGTVFLVPRIGTAHMVALVVCGQAFTSILFDHFGWLGVPHIEMTMSRVVGCGLLAVGAILIGR